MTFRRFSVGRLMALVGIVGLNLGLARVLASYEDADLNAGVPPIAIVLQLALLPLIRSRGRKRAFWVGFLLTGSLAMFSLVSAVKFLESGEEIFPLPFGGKPFLAIWEGYISAVHVLRPYLKSLPNQVERATVAFLPQFLAALAGGLVALSIHRGAESWFANSTSETRFKT